MAARSGNRFLRAMSPATRGTIGVIAFFVGVSVVSGLFGALLIGLLALLVE